MKNKKSIIFGGLLVVAAIAIALGGIYWKGLGDSDDHIDASSLSESASTADSSDIPASSVDELQPTDNNQSVVTSAEFVEMFEEGPETMYGRGTYASLSEIIQQNEASLERYDFVPVTTELGPVTFPSGHQLYRSRVDGQEYIISDGVPINVYDRLISNISAVRDDDGNRIYCLPNQSMVDTFYQQWEDGQKILSGESAGQHGDIILDGALIKYKFTEKDGEIYIDLMDIARLVNHLSYFEKGRPFFVITVNEWHCINIPTTTIGYGYKTYDVDHMDETFLFSSWSGEKFQIREKLWDADSSEVSVSQIARLIGWRMYFNGDVLSIVTDPCNQRNNAVLFPNGNLGIHVKLETDEHGDQWAVSYDDFGTELEKQPYVEYDMDSELHSDMEADPEPFAATSEQEE